MTNLNEHAGALSGIRVLDLSRVLAGPSATQILGDLGADILKIEHPERGDDTRAWGPPFMKDGESENNDFSAYFLSCNRNKRSLAVDIATDEGSDIIKRLASEADVVVENFKVGGLSKYGLDYESLKEANPALIYCSITGFGQTGPYASRGGYDFLIQGMSGLMSITGRPEDTPGAGPLKVGIPISDLVTGLYSVISILAALRHRDATGLGQFIDCSLLDSQVALLGNQGMNWLVGKKSPQPLGNSHPNVVPYRDFPTSDGNIIIACGNNRQFISLCETLGLSELANQEKFFSNAERVKNRVELETILSEATATWTSSGLIDAMSENGIPGGPINTIEEVFEDDQILYREMVQHIKTTKGTEIPYLRFPARLSESPATYRLAPPHVGQHTDDILEGVLKMSKEEIKSLRESGAIGD